MANRTTFAPDIVAAIMDDRLLPEVTLFELAAGTPALWEKQWGRLDRNEHHRPWFAQRVAST